MQRSIARVAIAGLAMAAVSGCHHKWGGGKGADVAKVTDEAKALVSDLTAAYNAHDAAKAASFDAPDYVSMFHDFPNAVGPAADEASMKQQFADPAAHFETTVASVDVAKSGDLAVVRTTYKFTSTDPKTKQPATESGNWVAGLKRQSDGSLKLAWSIGADVPSTPAPAASPTPAASPVPAATP